MMRGRDLFRSSFGEARRCKRRVSRSEGALGRGMRTNGLGVRVAALTF